MELAEAGNAVVVDVLIVLGLMVLAVGLAAIVGAIWRRRKG